jgi:hypothetical protein
MPDQVEAETLRQVFDLSAVAPSEVDARLLVESCLVVRDLQNLEAAHHRFRRVLFDGEELTPDREVTGVRPGRMSLMPFSSGLRRSTRLAVLALRESPRAQPQV